MKEKEKDKELGFENHIQMVGEIMLKLPAISIVRCGSVCTKFRTIITDSYLSKAPLSCLLLSNHQRLSCIHSTSQSQFLPPNQPSSCMAMQHPPPPNRRMNLVNSSHGLLCLRTSSTNPTPYLSYFVCNPLLGEILSVPPPPNPLHDDRHIIGLRPQDKHRPMGFNSSGDVWPRADDSNNLRSINSQCLLSFTAQTGVFKHIDIDVGVSASNIQATPHVLSYVSLRDMLHLPPGSTPLRLHKLSNDKNYGFGLFAM